MNFIYGSNEQDGISTIEKRMTFLMFFLHYSFFGILMFNIHFQTPYSSYISGAINLSCFLIALALIAKSFFDSSYPRLTASIYCAIIFLVYYGIIFIADNNIGTEQINEISQTIRGKLYVAYSFFIIAFAPFLMYFACERRLRYILSTPYLVYIPSLFSTLIILIINREALSSFSLLAAYSLIDPTGLLAGTIRYAIRQPPIFLIAVSPYLMFFGQNKINKFLLGPLGCGAAILGCLISDSRSTLVAFALILAYYGVVSIRNMGSFLYALITYLTGAFVIIPFLLMSKVLARFTELQNYSDYNLSDAGGLERIGLITWGFSQFLQSPIYGGSIFLKNSLNKGAWSHCTPITILYSTGIIGASLIFGVLIGAVKGALSLHRMYGVRSYWIYALFLGELTEMLFHGNTMQFFCSSIAVFLIANAIYIRKHS